MSPEPGRERGLDFGRTRIVKGRGLALAERLRAARRVPQAVVKVASFAQGYRQVRDLIDYISRDGELPLETEAGQWLTDVGQQRALAKDWAKTFDDRTNSRDVVHLIFSMPHGSDPEALRNAVRTVITRHFAGHEAVSAIHQDRKHPHAHVAMKMRARGQDKKIRLRKEELHRLREVFAEAAREQGIELAASPRAARGIGRKAERRTVRQLKQKGIVPKVEQQTARETLNELEQGTTHERPWEIAMFRRNEAERQSYLQDAERLRILASQQAQQTRQALLRAATDLEQFAKTMPTPKTLRQMMWEQLQGSSRPHPQGPTKEQDRQGGLDR